MHRRAVERRTRRARRLRFFEGRLKLRRIDELWPVSREAQPKPFVEMADGESLLLETLRRALALLILRHTLSDASAALQQSSRCLLQSVAAILARCQRPA